MFAWLFEKFGGLIIGKLFAAIGDFISGLRRDQANRDAGYAQSSADTLAKGAQAVKDANDAEIEATKDHTTMPGDEAFDQDFKRKD